MPKHYPCPDIAPPIFYKMDVCPVRERLQHHMSKWSMLTLAHLSFGSHRFSELLGAIPDVSQRMLTQTLRRLERDGLIERTAQATVPPRVDYKLSELGRTLLPALQALLEWSATHRKAIDAARASYDAAQKATPLAVKTDGFAARSANDHEAARMARRRDVRIHQA